jgi:hypothetical protein
MTKDLMNWKSVYKKPLLAWELPELAMSSLRQSEPFGKGEIKRADFSTCGNNDLVSAGQTMTIILTAAAAIASTA